MNKTQTITGGCYCGAIRYESTEPPVGMGSCNCRMCQRWTGSAAAMGVFFDLRSFAFTKGEPRGFNTSPILERHFCADCGTSLGHRYVVGDTTNIQIVAVGTLDDTGIAAGPEFYFGMEDHLSNWMELQEGVPQIRADTAPQTVKRWA